MKNKEDAKHKNEKDIIKLLAYTASKRCNLLLNTGTFARWEHT